MNLRNATVGNLIDLAAVTVPVGRDAAGLPVGLQVMAKAGDDKRLVEIVLGMEAVLGRPATRLGKPDFG